MHLFISYTQAASGEYALARALETRLRERGTETFRDEASIAAGADWKSVLHQRVNEWATHILFIVSEASLNREWVRYEMQIAQERHIAEADFRVLWLSFNRESGLPAEHWLNGIQALHVPGKQPGFILEGEWVAAVETALGVSLGPSALPVVFRDYVRDKTSHFVGREHVFSFIRQFIARERSGYVTLIGDPGIGKTAILCELTKRERCVAHFFIRTSEIDRAEQMHQYIGQQLHDHFGIDTSNSSGDPVGARLSRWLADAAAKMAGAEKLILVIDAIDECVDIRLRENQGNMLLLPRKLPDNVYCILSRRSLDKACFNIQLETEPGTGNEPLELMKFVEDNRRDVESYIRAFFEEHPENSWLRKHRAAVTDPVDFFAKKSEGNFMYLRYVLPQLSDKYGALGPDELPQGLEEYYVGHWKRMISDWQHDPSAALVFDVIFLMVVDHSPRTVRQVAEMLSIPLVQVRPLIQRWREFLDEEVLNGQTAYRIYHWSFAEFLEKQDSVVDASAVAGKRQKQASFRIQNFSLKVLFGG